MKENTVYESSAQVWQIIFVIFMTPLYHLIFSQVK
jgi:hypothetical protein